MHGYDAVYDVSTSGDQIIRLYTNGTPTSARHILLANLEGNGNIASRIRVFPPPDDTNYYDSVGELIWKLGIPILLLLGTFGNVSCLIVMTKNDPRVPTHLLLSCLAIFDTLGLYIGLSRYWVFYLTDGIDIWTFSEAVCKFGHFFVYYLLQCSSWILVAVTIERFIVTCAPIHAKTMTTTRNAVIALVTMFIALFILNSHYFHTVELIITRKNETLCWSEDLHNRLFLDRTWALIDLTVYSLVPLVIIFVCNVSIIVKVRVSHRRTSCGNARVVPNRQKRISSMTAMLVTVNFVFMITTLPISIYVIVFYQKGKDYLHLEVKNSQNREQILDSNAILWPLLNLLQYSNNALNFYLYCISGPRFREQYSQLFRRFSNRIAPNPSETTAARIVETPPIERDKF
ncbi:C-C chemokine receptor 1-like protein 1 [Tubulanus polymorphus]|uniref:C-C chemokine receptor 1-like protein 1 n=1 Tax=Tubulanus polymorphus TaxID=672921 RepID=UPI003DA36E49